MPRTVKSRLSPRKAPLQSRSQATVEVILQAAARVLAKESLIGFNTNRVAEVAGVSVGSLYQYFPGKEALVTALIERHQAQLIVGASALAQSLAGLTALQKLEGICQAAIEQQYAQPKLAAALDHEERRLPLASSLRKTQQTLVSLVLQLLRPNLPNVSEQQVADVLTIAKALVEADADGRTPAADLKPRMM